MIEVGLCGISQFAHVDDGLIRDARAAIGKIRGLDGHGWLDLPKAYSPEQSRKIRDAANEITQRSDVLIVAGIGGSYLGARAAIELLRSPFYNALPKRTPDIYFAGNNASGEYLEQIIALIAGRDFSVNLVSKSGSTIETALAARVLRGLVEAKYGAQGIRERFYITTDAGSPLHKAAATLGCASFEIPPGVGGRYSVLTAVGLLPLAVAGIDIDEVMAGALAELETGEDAVCRYAAARQALYRAGNKIEVLASFEPAFAMMGQWWKQLYGESEGKNGIGIFPALADYTADLHSLGQYMQEGERTLLETFVTFKTPRARIKIPGTGLSDDGLDSLIGRSLDDINAAAVEAVKTAHIDGGVPVIDITAPDISARTFGALVYFFELACAASALVSGVNPFGQPGVEAYKRNMYSILGIER